MSFQALKWKNKNVGHVWETPNGRIVFGNRYLLREDLSRLFPDEEFCFLKQVHSNRLVEATTTSLPEADAHSTRLRHRAPVIQTADCLPILLLNQDIAVAVHAGWRGLASGILPNVLNTLSVQPQSWMVGIGPHIGEESFQFGRDLLPDLLKSYTADIAEIVKPTEDPLKVRVNLLKIAVHQLLAAGLRPSQLATVPVDTYVSPDHISFRRNGGEPLRQLSFVVRN
jgi:YfiH family protein